MHGVCKCKAEIQRWHPMPSIAYFFLHTHTRHQENPEHWVVVYTELKGRLTREFKINVTVVLL